MSAEETCAARTGGICACMGLPDCVHGRPRIADEREDTDALLYPEPRRPPVGERGEGFDPPSRADL